MQDHAAASVHPGAAALFGAGPSINSDDKIFLVRYALLTRAADRLEFSREYQ